LQHHASTGQSLPPGGAGETAVFRAAASRLPRSHAGKSVAENSVEASIRHVTVINVGNGSIHNSTQIQAVWLQGKYFDQAALTQLHETAKAAAKH
jgi:hypothetical protein